LEGTVVVYEDAVVIGEILNQAVAEDLDLFPAFQQASLIAQQSLVQGLVNDGPGNFGGLDILNLLLAAEETLNILVTLPCESFVDPDNLPVLSTWGVFTLVALLGATPWMRNHRRR
jgi:hypothetical protein